MSTNITALLVVTNCADLDSAQTLARKLVEHKLAACVNCVPGVHSIYRWQGQVEEAAETALWIKTSAERYPEVEAAIRANHPYEIPEIIALPITAGSAPYLGWIAKETQKDSNE